MTHGLVATGGAVKCGGLSLETWGQIIYRFNNFFLNIIKNGASFEPIRSCYETQNIFYGVSFSEVST